MPGIVDRIVQTKSLLETTASLAVLLLQYVALSSLVTLPHGPSELARVLSLALTITVTLMIFVLSKQLKAMGGMRVVLIALIFAVAGTGLALNYSSYAGRHVKVEPQACSEGRPEIVIMPETASAGLAPILDVHGDIETALCDVEDQASLRRTIERENDWETNNLVVRLVLSQLLLVIGILVVAWKAILHSRAPAAASREAPADRADSQAKAPRGGGGGNGAGNS